MRVTVFIYDTIFLFPILGIIDFVNHTSPAKNSNYYISELPFHYSTSFNFKPQ